MLFKFVAIRLETMPDIGKPNPCILYANHPRSLVNRGNHIEGFYSIISSPGSVLEEIKSVLDQLAELMFQAGQRPSDLLKLNFFVRDPRYQLQLFSELKSRYGRQMPIVSVIGQPPLDGGGISLEASTLKQNEKVRIIHLGPKLNIVQQPEATWAHIGGIVPSITNMGLTTATMENYLTIWRLLNVAGIPAANTIRFWLYVGDILKQDPITGGQNYANVNTGRKNVFQPLNFHLKGPKPEKSIPPASTGIGQYWFPLTMEALALALKKPDLVNGRPLQNKAQTNTFDYDKTTSGEEVVLKAGADGKDDVPMFSRGYQLKIGDYGMVIISGTASIEGRETKHKGDILNQTLLCIKNVHRVINQVGANLSDLPFVRVYIARVEGLTDQQYDFHVKVVKKIIREFFPDQPCLFLEGHVCRDDWLVEIEAIAFTGPQG